MNCNKINWKFQIGDNIKDNKRDININNQLYLEDKQCNNKKFYQYSCNKCGFDSKNNDVVINEKSLKKGVGCLCCAGKIVVTGINDIATTDSWMIEYLTNKEDAYRYTHKSNKEISMTCPFCGKTKIQSIDKLQKQGFACPICGDGISYPEKVFMSILDQLHINYKWQLTKKSFEWCKNYKYDFYLIDYNYIIEINGMQHYELRKDSCFGSIQEVMYNDLKKKKLALENNIDKYIILDCRYSSLEYILSSIKESELVNILNLKQVDYNLINKYANKSLMIEICNKYNELYPNISTNILSNMYVISRTTITRYLKEGNKVGLCNYKDVQTGSSERGNKNSKPIKVICNNNTYYFRTVKILKENYMKLFSKTMTLKCVYAALKEKRNEYDNMIFKYCSKEEFNNAEINVYGDKYILSIL